MSLHNFNSNTKSWKMYTNTLTSISGDDLLVMPSYGKDIILEVSANNDIFFKKGTITKRFDNLVSDYLDMSFNSLNSQIQYILQEISGNSVKDFITSGISNDLLIKPYDGRDIILEVSGNNEIIFKRGDLSYNLDDLIGGGGGGGSSQNSDYAKYNILDITGKIIFTDNSNISNIEINNDASFNNVDISGSLNVMGTVSASNIYTKSQVDASLVNVYTKSQVDASLANIYTKSQVDASLANIYTKSQVDASLANIYTKSQVDASLSNVYTKSQVDASLSNVYTKSQVDASLANIYTKSQVDASLVNVYTKSQVDASLVNVYTKLSIIDSSLVNVYTRGQVDVSFVSKQLFDASLSSIQLSNVYTKSQVDASFVSRQLFEASYNVLAASNGGGGGGYIQNNENISFDILNITDTIIFTDSSNVELYNDASFNNVDISGSLNVMGTVSASNLYTKTEVDVSFVSKELFDASLSSIQLTNVYTKTEVDVSFVSKQYFEASYNVYSKTEIDASFANVYTKSEVDASLVNVYTKSQVDASFANIYSKSQVDVSFVSKQLFDASINALQTIIINNGSSGSVSITPKKFYNNNWNLLGNNITTIKDISGMSTYIMGSSADGYTIFVRWNTSTEYTSAPNQTQRRPSLGVYKFISNSWTQIGSTFLFPFADIPAWRYAENGNGDAVGFVDNLANQKTEYMNSAGNRIAFTVSMPKFGPNQGDYLPNENTTYIYDFNGTDWVSVGTPRVTNVDVVGIGFSFENSITKMFVLNTHTNITIFTHNGTSFVEDAAQISQQTIHNNIGYGYTAHFISTNGKVICIITNNKIILFKFNETSWEQYGNVITIPQWPTNDHTQVSGSYDGSIFMSIYRGRTVNGDINAGMIKIFKHNSATNTWIQIGQDIVYEEVTYIDEAQGLQLGSDAKCISGDGTVITVGTRFYPDRYIQHVGPWLNGYVQAYKYSSVNNYWSKIGNDITGQNDERPGQYARLNYNGSVLILDGQTYRDTNSSINSGRVRVFEIDI